MVAAALLLGAGIWAFVGENLRQRFGWPDLLVVVIYTVPDAAIWVLFAVRRFRRA